MISHNSNLHYISPVNQHVAPAIKDEFQSLHIGPLKIWPPVILAPMAGVTNWPFRVLCQRYGAGLYVSEMITARPLVEGREKTLKLSDFGPDEKPRSLQLYGVDPYFVGEAVKRLVSEGKVDHIDLNFGCPVPKVTRKGGGSAIPVKPNLLRNIVRAAVKNAEHIPVTIKFRMGINEQILTFLDAGKIGEEEGCKAVALHARTAEQLYDGHARWEAISELKHHVTTIPVLGNGDIWEGLDAIRMMRQTHCDGVVVGRGCLGKPWLFRDLARVFDGKLPETPPHFGAIKKIMLEHATLLCTWAQEKYAMRMFRKHASWYTKGFRDSARFRQKLMRVTTLQELEDTLNLMDENEPFPPTAMRVPRGKTSGTQKVSLPADYLQNREDDTPPTKAAAEAFSGG